MSHIIIPISRIESTPTPTPNRSPTPTPTVSASSPVVTATPTPSVSSSPIPSPTPTPTLTPTPSPDTIDILSHPASQTIDIETQTSTSLEVIAKSNSNLFYSWQISTDNGNEWTYLTSGQPSSNNSILYINNLQPDINNTKYRCEITNNAFSVLSDIATLNIIQDINISNQPLDTTISSSGTAAFSIGVS